jgi:hypothetical protein
MATDDADLLYHYTSAGGLIGIVNKPAFPEQYKAPRFNFERALRVFGTDVRYLNDEQELAYAGKIFGKRFARGRRWRDRRHRAERPPKDHAAQAV